MVAARSHSPVLLAACTALALAFSPIASTRAQDRPLAPMAGAMIPPWSPTSPAPPPVDPQWQAWDPAYAMRTAQLHAAPGGSRVLRAAESMIDEGTVVRGSCYDWVDAVYSRAGGQWHDTFRSPITRGPYAQAQDFQPGDWVMFINEGFGGDAVHTHSAIFVAWADQGARVAVMMSYPGGRRDEPGRYGTYELTHAYRIERMEDAAPPPTPAHRAGRSAHHGRAASSARPRSTHHRGV